MAEYEMRWDCPSCEKQQLGRHKVCQSCGRPRGEDVEFYDIDDAVPITDSARLDEANAGPDWHCNHCGSDNRGDHGDCKQCGAAREDSESRSERLYALDEIPRSDEDADRLIEEDRAAEEAEKYQKASAGVPGYGKSGYYQAPAEQDIRGIRDWIYNTVRNPITIGIAAVCLIGLLVWFFTSTRPVSVSITGFQWQRSVEIERYATLNESDWDAPADAYDVSHRRKFHHNDRVIDHYVTRTETCTERVQTGSRTERYVSGRRSKGNGYSEDVYSTRSIPTYSNVSKTRTRQDPVYRNVPVYRDWYTYKIDRWVHDRTPQSSGYDQEARWPDFTLQGKERENGRTESYEILLVGPKQKQLRKDLPFAKWEKYQLGDTLTAHVTRLGTITRIE